MNQNRSSASVVAVAIVALLMVVLMIASLSRSVARNDQVGRDAVTVAEGQHLRRLAGQIRSQTTDAADPFLEDAVSSLSIREAAVLGGILLKSGYNDVERWMRLPAKREAQAITRLEKVLVRCTQLRTSSPAIETVIRGSPYLRSICGDELLKEVIGVQIRPADEEGLEAPANVTDDDLRVISAFPGLERVWIDWAPITDRGVAELASLPNLVEVHLFNCELLTDTSIRFVARPQLRVLDLRYDSAISDAGIALLNDCRGLQSLSLAKTDITSTALSTIAKFGKLQDLDLSQTAIRDGLDQLSKLPELKTLDLSQLGDVDHPIPWKNLTFLSDCHQLESIDLSSTAVRRIELRHLKHLKQLRLGNRSLRELVLIDLPQLPEVSAATDWKTMSVGSSINKVNLQGLSSLFILSLAGVTDSASNELAQGLADSPKLFQIDLPVSVMTDQLAMAIGNLQSLERLSIKDSLITGDQLRSVLRAPKLQILDCNGERLAPRDWTALGQSSLKHFGVHRLNSDDLFDLADWKDLEQIEFYECRVGQLVLRNAHRLYGFSFHNGAVNELRISDCPQLKRISLLETTGDRVSVQSCNRLESFFAGYKSKVTAISLQELKSLSQITIQEHSEIGDLQLSDLPALKSASFWLMNSLPLQVLDELTKFPTLRRLDISHTKFGDEAALIIARMEGLESLYASSLFSRNGLMELRPLRRLKELNLYRRSNADWSKEEVRSLLPNVKGYCVFDVRAKAAVPADND